MNKTLKEISKDLANKANMPYAWEDVMERISKGIALPFKPDKLYMRNITKEQAFDIAKLAYSWPDEMKNLEFKYKPYDPTDYEDAYELISVTFKGPVFADKETEFRMDIHADLNVHMHYRPLKPNENGLHVWQFTTTRNQYKIHKRFRDWGITPEYY